MKEKFNRSNMSKFLGSVLFILILAFLLLVVSFLFSPAKDKKLTMQAVKPNGLLAEEDNTIDVLFIGDSETYAGFSPVQMYIEQGFTSYVCATSSQYVSLSKSFLEQALEHQKPKLVVLEPYHFFRKMRSDNALITKIENMFSILQFHNRWKDLCPIKFGEEKYTWKDNLKGYQYYTTTTMGMYKNYMEYSDELHPIPDTNVQTVRDIVSICKEKNIDVVFASSPSLLNWTYKKHNTIQKIADELGVEYIDMNLEKSIHIDWHTDTIDRGDHINFYGVKKTNAFLGKYLKETYSLPDRRGDSAYSAWEEAATEFKTTTDY